MEDFTLDHRAAPVLGANVAEFSKSAVSWAAILSGAVVAAATSLLLLVLATGLGLTAVSPWPDNGASAGTLAVMTAIAFIDPVGFGIRWRVHHGPAAAQMGRPSHA